MTLTARNDWNHWSAVALAAALALTLVACSNGPATNPGATAGPSWTPPEQDVAADIAATGDDDTAAPADDAAPTDPADANAPDTTAVDPEDVAETPDVTNEGDAVVVDTDEAPDADQPDADQPDADQPDADQPDTNEPDADEPDAGEPDSDEGSDATGGGDDSNGGEPDVDKPVCVDEDGDEFGTGCELGDDCDDKNKNFAVYCPDCSKGTFDGCPCKSGPVPCYTGDPLFIGKGACKAGLQQCIGGFYGVCVGEVLPDAEGCDSVDNDCDGLTDEGVLSSCGNCDMSCTKQGQGPATGAPFDPAKDNSSGVKLDQNGYLILDAKQTAQTKHFIWIANSPEASISKLDTKTGWETARYYVCSSPSRTSVDLIGDVWVGCRGDGGVVKIHAEMNTCSDKNGNGKIDTSTDLNGDHMIQPNEMMPKGQDECIWFTVYPDGNTVARAAGVDKDNFAWVGWWSSKHLRRLDPLTGASVHLIAIPSNPYGLVIDQKGIIWVSGRSPNQLVRVDPKTDAVKGYNPGGGYTPYGINVDVFGKIWTPHYPKGQSWRFDPLTGQWATVQHQTNGRGCATSNDGYIYVANDASSSIAIINGTTLQNEGQVSVSQWGKYPVGVALDFDGYVWAVLQSPGGAVKIDPKTKQVIGSYPTGKSPYTYSDMTGYTLANFTAPSGQYKTIFGIAGYQGDIAEIPESTEWQSIDVQSVTPGDSYYKMRFRAAQDLDKLLAVPWVAPNDKFNDKMVMPYDISAMQPPLKGRFLQVELEIHAGDKDNTPVIKSIQAKGKLQADGP